MSSPKSRPVDPFDLALKHRLRNWAANQPLPRNGRARLLKTVLLSTSYSEQPPRNTLRIDSSLKFNWTATYLAGDKLLNLRLVS